MCKTGDIILVDNYIDNGSNLCHHSFVVINDEAGQIQGLDYDFICNVMSSFKSEAQRIKKLSYPGNFEILHTDTIVDKGNDRDGFIKAEQFYYFNKEKISFIIIGRMTEDAFNELIEFIKDLKIEIKQVVDNL